MYVIYMQHIVNFMLKYVVLQNLFCKIRTCFNTLLDEYGASIIMCQCHYCANDIDIGLEKVRYQTRQGRLSLRNSISNSFLFLSLYYSKSKCPNLILIWNGFLVKGDFLNNRFVALLVSAYKYITLFYADL
jgi:hypothetical protein